MQWVAQTQTPRVLKCLIYDDVFTNIHDQSTSVGYYLKVQELSGGERDWDYLQDTLEQAKEFALEEFQVPIDGWVVVS